MGTKRKGDSVNLNCDPLFFNGRPRGDKGPRILTCMIIYFIISVIMNELYKPPFKRFVKKQSRPFQLAIEDETEKVKEQLDIGEAKTGDLKGVRVHKFKFHGTEYLMAYKVIKGNTIFSMIGTHENFYRELKRYIREE